MMDVTLLGTGGVFPLPQRPLTAAYVRAYGRALLLDCGEGTQTAIRAAGLRFKPIDAIVLTHVHADHVAGLPGLLLTMGNEGRREPVTLAGPRGLTRIVEALLTITQELPFSLILRELDPEESTPFPCAGFTLTPIPLHHTLPCLGYRLDLPRPGRFDPVAARERGVPLALWSRLQQGESLEGYTPADVLGPPRQGLALIYATDTRPVPALAQLGRKADLMILEGMFGDPEKSRRAKESLHMTMQEAAAIAREAEAGALWLTHFSPATPHPEEYARQVAEIFPNGMISQPGQRTTLVFPD